MLTQLTRVMDFHHTLSNFKFTQVSVEIGLRPSAFALLALIRR